MPLTWTLILFCCLRLIPTHFVGACSSFPNHICCSSSRTPSESFDQIYVPGIEYTMAEPGAMIDALPKSLRILCFGDSLTAGYTSYGLEFYPYADHLRAGLQSLLSTSDIETEVAGFSGDQVRGAYMPRIKAKCGSTRLPYDWIIVMGGTNDLGWGQSPDEIYEGLSKHLLPLSFQHRSGGITNYSGCSVLDTSSLSISNPYKVVSLLNELS